MRKQVVLFGMVLSLALMANITQGRAQNAEDPYVIIVEFSFDEQQVDSRHLTSFWKYRLSRSSRKRAVLFTMCF